MASNNITFDPDSGIPYGSNLSIYTGGDFKARFNVLRIYRRYKNPKECKIITKDMKYIDRKYLGPDAKTSDIC